MKVQHLRYVGLVALIFFTVLTMETVAAACQPEYYADGDCDDSSNNNAECGYDSGDCCEASCVDADRTCGDFNCIDPAYQCDLTSAGDGNCDVQNNIGVCGYDGGDCCSCTCKDYPPRRRGGHHGHSNNCHDVEDSETCKDPNAPCLDGYVEAGTLTTVTVEANAFKKTPLGGPRGGRGAQGKRYPESGGDSGCARQGCEAELTRDGDVRSDESRWSCAQKITLDEEGLCHITFSFEQAQDIKYLQVAFWKPAKFARSMQVTSNGEDMGTFESSSESVFTAFDIAADGVETLILTASGLDMEEWIGLLEVRFMVEEKANKKKAG